MKTGNIKRAAALTALFVAVIMIAAFCFTACGEKKEEEPPAVTVASISLDITGAKTEFTVGETFVSDGVKVTAKMSDGTEKTVAIGDCTVSSPDMSKAGSVSVTVTYEGKTASYKITVRNAAEPEPGDDRTDYRYEAEYAEFGGTGDAGRPVSTEICGGWEGSDEYFLRPDGTNDECVCNLFLGKGGYITFRMFSDAAAPARISFMIGTSSFGSYPELDKYAKVYVNDVAVPTGIVYDASLPVVGVQPWWEFQLYEMASDVTLEEGLNEISIRTYGYADITLDEGDTSAAAGGRNIGSMTVSTEATLTEEADEVTGISVSAGEADTEYVVGDRFSADGIVVTAAYSDGSTRVLGESEYEVTAPDMTAAGEKTVSVSWKGRTAEYEINVSEPEVPPEQRTDYRYEAEFADYGGGTVATENCGDATGQLLRPDGTNDECVKDLFLGEGGYVTFRMFSDRAADARLSFSIGTGSFGIYPEVDKYAKVYVNGVAVPTGIVYDASKPLEDGGVEPWWTFQLYEMATDVTLKQGLNEISVRTYGYADITLDEGDNSAAAGGRNIGYMIVSTSAVLGSEKDNVVGIAVDASGANTEFTAGDRFVSDGIKVTATYSDDGTRVLGESEYEVTAPDMTEAGDKTVTVSWNGKTAEYRINVAEPVADDRTEYRFEAENGILDGDPDRANAVDTEQCGGWQRPDGTADECVKGMFNGTGGSITFRISCDKATTAKLSVLIGIMGFSDYSDMDKYMRIIVNDEPLKTGFVYDDTKEVVGMQPWWEFQLYTMSSEIELTEGVNTIVIATYDYAGLPVADGDSSPDAGGRNIGHIVLKTDGVLTEAYDIGE